MKKWVPDIGASIDGRLKMSQMAVETLPANGPGHSDRAPTRMPISARNVTVRFGDVVALDDFSAGIPRGTVGLLGPNGAGKSTFIKASLGLVHICKGTISVRGLDSRTQSLWIRDDIGYMPEHDCLIQSINAVETVSYFGMISGMTSRDAIQRGHEVLDFVGIGEERYRVVKSYSTGMKQKVKLAQALVHDPSILFLDEPTSGMDPQGREEMLDLVKKIGASDKTVMVSSHILQEVEQVCDHIVIISGGKLIREGGTKSLLAGEEGVQSLIVRGEEASLVSFVKALRSICETVDQREEGGRQVALLIKGFKDGKRIFQLASENTVQIRSYRPERLDLEEVFLRAFKGGGRGGN